MLLPACTAWVYSASMHAASAPALLPLPPAAPVLRALAAEEISTSVGAPHQQLEMLGYRRRGNSVPP